MSRNATNDSTNNFAVVVLAAGNASRFGSCKLSEKIGNSALIYRVSTILKKSFDQPIYFILGAYKEKLADLLPNEKIIVNPDWQLGIGSSIKTGVKFIDGKCDGVLFVLADQYALSTDDYFTFRQLVEKNGDKIICCRYGHDTDQLGPPVYFPKRYFKTLVEIDPTKGAKHIVKKYEASVLWIEIPTAILDVDFPADLQKAKLYYS